MYYIWSSLRFTHFTFFPVNFLLGFGDKVYIVLFFFYFIIYGHFWIHTSRVESLLLGFLTGIKKVECDTVKTRNLKNFSRIKKKRFTVYF